MLKREGRDGLARAAFAYLPERVRLDLSVGFPGHGRFFTRLPLSAVALAQTGGANL